MEQFRGLETLSTELFIAIISHIPRVSDQRALSLVSWQLHNQVMPHLYRSWNYHGNEHSFKSLHCFLRTVILHEGLASLVMTLDIRGWEEPDTRGQSEPRSSSDDTYGGDIDLFQSTLHDLGLEADHVGHHEVSVREGDEDGLLAILIAKLPNLQTLYMDLPGGVDSILNMMEVLSEQDKLAYLDTVYVLRMGSINEAYQYLLELKSIRSLSQVRSIRSLSSLRTCHRYLGIKFRKYLQTSNISELAFDEAEFRTCAPLVQMLPVPKALKSLRWTQEFCCFNSGTCEEPPYRELGQGPICQKEHLENLDLDLQWHFCRGKGHPGNPYARKEDILADWRYTRKSDVHLIGSLKEFSALKTLSIHPSALCGIKDWGVALYRMVDILPVSLEALSVIFKVEDPKRQAEGIEKQIWIHELMNLAEEARREFPKLRKITVVTVDKLCLKWRDHVAFAEIKEACMVAGIMFGVVERKASEDMTPVPYFHDIKRARNLERIGWGIN